MSLHFWNKIFQKKHRLMVSPDVDFEKIDQQRADVDFAVEEERTRYVIDFLERYRDTKRELILVEGEYDQVSSYLSDLETLADLPDGEKKQLEGSVEALLQTEKEYKDIVDTKGRMADEDYYRIRNQEGQILEALRKINEAENMAGLIKQDLKKLDREKQSYKYRAKELEKMFANYKGMSLIFLVSFGVCMLLLCVMQFALQMQVMIGYFVAVVLFAVAMTVIYVKYSDADREFAGLVKAQQRLIRLTNTVKIRYVNNTNLLSYYYLKYHTDSGKKLEKDYEAYLEEAKLRARFTAIEERREELQNFIFNKLAGYQIRYPKRLSVMPECILDHREQVEQRHSLILRRQALRKQVEYNRKITEEIKAEILLIESQYPAYKREIDEMVHKYCGENF